MDDFLERITEAVNNGVYNRWIVYAHNNLRITKKLAEYEAEDIVSIVISKTYEGVRTWKPELPIDIYMKNNIRSIISALLKRKKNEEVPTRIDDEGFELDLIKYNGTISEEELHKDLDYKEMLKEVEELLSDDDEALLVLDEWKKGSNNIEIGKELGLTTQEVSNIKRRIKYKTINNSSIYFN